jgi:hypothetical protein
MSMRGGVLRNLAADGNRPAARRECPRTPCRLRFAREKCPISKQGDNLSDLQITQTGGSETGGQLMITQTNVGNGN